MELLAQARPASLDPGADAGQRQHTIAAALLASQQTANPGPAPGPHRPRVPRAALGAGLTLAAAGTAAAVFVASSGPGSVTGPRPSKTASKATAVLSAQQILLTAAVSAAKQPSQGRYWRVEQVSGSVMAAGPNAHPYAVEQTGSPSVTWDARSAGRRSWTIPAAGYTTRPASAGAAAAWRADGSPKLASQHGAQQAFWQTGGAVGGFADGNLTFAQFQRLPASPSGLAAAVGKAARRQLSPPLSQGMFFVYDQLLLDPITPAVRATVFRDLARLPGVHSIGKVTDPLGRTGYGISQLQGTETRKMEEVLVIAPGSGLLLADEQSLTGASGPAPASGATPGLGSCPKGTAISGARQQHQDCMVPAALARRLHLLEGSDPGNRPVVIPAGPEVDLPSGQMQSYDAVISAGWTDASPLLPPVSEQFNAIKDSKG
jgi:hypothetical protein